VRPRLLQAYADLTHDDPDEYAVSGLWEDIVTENCIDYQLKTFKLIPNDLKVWALKKINLVDDLEFAFDQVHAGLQDSVLVSMHKPLNAYDRYCVHVLAEIYGLGAESYKEDATNEMLSKKMYPVKICRSTESEDIIAQKQLVTIPEAFSLADMLMPLQTEDEAYSDIGFATQNSSVSSKRC
jgi:hypothetical protein